MARPSRSLSIPAKIAGECHPQNSEPPGSDRTGVRHMSISTSMSNPVAIAFNVSIVGFRFPFSI